jgi:hypothetical protein
MGLSLGMMGMIAIYIIGPPNWQAGARGPEFADRACHREERRDVAISKKDFL